MVHVGVRVLNACVEVPIQIKYGLMNIWLKAFGLLMVFFGGGGGCAHHVQVLKACCVV